MAFRIENPLETIVGAAVLAIAAGFAVYAAQGPSSVGGAGEMQLVAKFRSASGVSAGTDVRIAGVKVGRVVELDLDPTTFQAAVTLSIRDDVELSDETIAKIDSEGLLGGSYISLEPAEGFAPLASGDEIANTQGAVSLVDLLAQFATSTPSDSQ